MNLSKTFAAVQYASRKLLALNDEKINQILLAVADAAEERTDFILAENRKDLNRMDTSNPKYDRLMLTPERLKGIATDIRKVAKLPSPVGRVQKQGVMPNGLKIKRVSVPFGVIGIIYEARPNVSFDVFSLCLKSGNACILKGGSDADCSNRAIISVIHDVLKQFETDLHFVELIPSDRVATTELLHANGYVDLIIPRGSSNLINFVRQNATIPVIETGAGICHVYVDRDADLDMAVKIIVNAKTSRPSVCNAEEVCLVHRAIAKDFLPRLKTALVDERKAAGLAPVELRLDEASTEIITGTSATERDFDTEFLDYILAVAVVDDLDAAIAHVQHHSTHHSDCIVTENQAAADRFVDEVDSAAVYVNVSTRFTDGGEFGLGCEMGISTQTLHARGPMGLRELTTYKNIVTGD